MALDDDGLKRFHELLTAWLTDPQAVSAKDVALLYSELLATVRRNLGKGAQRRVDLEDVLQSVCRSGEDHRQDGTAVLSQFGNCREWLLEAAARHAGKHKKQSQRKPTVPFGTTAAGEVIEPADEWGGPADAVDEEEVAAGFEAVLGQFEQRLTARGFRVLILRFCQKKARPEIAGIEKVVVGTINRDIDKIKKVALEIFPDLELTDE